MPRLHANRPNNFARRDVALGRYYSTTQADRTMAELSSDLPPVIYFVETRDGVIKIGYTTNLRRRLKELALDWNHVLAVVPGAIPDETILHRRFREHIAYRGEYFCAVPEIIEHINEIRTSMGLSALPLPDAA